MISAGHQWPAIHAYTLPQLRLFVHAAAAQERSRMASAMIAARVAQAPVDEFRRALRELER